jgi:formiminotetrahydrofolate cyclodeaminase
MKLTDMSVVDLLAALRSSSPTPGGGSASALAGALGASLLAMVASMQSRRAPSEADVDRLQGAGHQCIAHSERLAALVDRDADAYALVVEAFRLPKTSDAEKVARSARIQEAMKSAIEAPLDVMRECLAAVEAANIIADLGNPNAASDVGVALELLGAGLRGAKLNVEINLGSIKDAGYAERTRQQISTLLAECDRNVAAARTHLTRLD